MPEKVKVIIYTATWMKDGEYIELDYMTLDDLRCDIIEYEGTMGIELHSIEKTTEYC